MNEVRALYLYKGLRERGFSKEQAAMTLAGFMSESGPQLEYDKIQGVKSTSRLSKTELQRRLAKRDGAAIGLFQADSGAKTKLLRTAESKGIDWRNPEYQLDFLTSMVTDESFGGITPYGRRWFNAVRENQGKSDEALAAAFIDLYRTQSAARGNPAKETLAQYEKKAFMPFSEWSAKKGRGNTRKDMADYMMDNMNRRDAGSIVKKNRDEALAIRKTIESGSRNELLALGQTMFFERAGTLHFEKNRIPDINKSWDIADKADQSAMTSRNYKAFDDAGFKQLPTSRGSNGVR